MSEHIYNAFLDASIISHENWTKGIKELYKEKIKNAHLAELTIQMESTAITSLENPLIQDLGHRFELRKINHFHFGNIQVRTMSNMNRIRIDNYLEILKKDKWKTYEGKLRRVYMITELYYGSIQIILNKALKSELEGSIQQSQLEVEQTVEFDKSIEYTFKHNSVPFAMRLEKMKAFNG
ncbi:hypothetical protein [Lutimonas sp.]|uniref:hypothetical protein n=1 Tax=Lutimonas sp. TaxID=1872403 RepID=UPI003D9BBA79